MAGAGAREFAPSEAERAVEVFGTDMATNVALIRSVMGKVVLNAQQTGAAQFALNTLYAKRDDKYFATNRLVTELITTIEAMLQNPAAPSSAAAVSGIACSAVRAGGAADEVIQEENPQLMRFAVA